MSDMPLEKKENKTLTQEALDYHADPLPGKLEIRATKAMRTREDLALAYSPGVAAPCEVIAQDPLAVSRFTARGNLVAVISNGTAVLGLGNIGPLASKPVMEGKAVLFKKFAGVDVFDLEIQENDPDKLVDIIASLEPTFGGINLEDIKAPDCFYIEQKLRERLKIPVFHDDQHGTAIIVAAALLNGLKLTGKSIETIKCVVSGAGAAALACLDLLCAFGLRKENVYVTDAKGVLYVGRPEPMDPYKMQYAQETNARTLRDLMEGADFFLGLSVAGALTPEMVAKMAPHPLIFTLANPIPEIMPQEVRQVRPDAIIATGRSDYPNQVNNVLCFPYIFRGALDVGAATINQEMKMACVEALAHLALQEPSDVVSAAYGGENHAFGPEHLIPKPFDPRLMIEIAPAVAQAAMDTGIATRPLHDMTLYRQKLSNYIFRSGAVMQTLFLNARNNPKRVVFAEGEAERVLQAVQTVVSERLAFPTLIGRREVIQERIQKLGLRFQLDKDVALIDPSSNPFYDAYWMMYHRLMERKGVSPETAQKELLFNHTVLAALHTLKGEADALICGPAFHYERPLYFLTELLGFESETRIATALNALVLNQSTLFFCDAYVNPDPNAFEIAHIASLATKALQGFGLTPKVAFISHSNFGSVVSASSQKMRDALVLFREMHPEIEAEGEMHTDAALDPQLRARIFPHMRLQGRANLLIMPNLETAHIAFNAAKGASEGQPIGPLLLGLKKPAHILTSSTTVRGILNMTVFAATSVQS